MGRPHKCPACGADGKSVSKGMRKTKTLGIRRIRLCKACGRKFTPKNQKPSEVEEQPAPIEVPAPAAVVPTAADSSVAALEPANDLSATGGPTDGAIDHPRF